jgi:hypothetical protein
VAHRQDAICLLTSTDPDNRGFGTGFVFHRDSTGRSFLLTCLHVVQTLEKSPRGGQREPPGLLADGLVAEVWLRGDAAVDLAVLAVDGLRAPPLKLGRPIERGRAVEIAGYTEYEPAQQTVVSRPLVGRVRDNNPVKSLKYPGRIGLRSLDIEIDPDLFRELKDGYSGSPVVDPTTGEVVGIMNLKWSEAKGHAICVGSCRLLFDKPNARRIPDYACRSTARRPAGVQSEGGRVLPDRFLVAFSFAGEQRHLVRAIAQAVESLLGPGTVFLDDWYEFWLAGADADRKLQDLYERRCALAVVCVSGRYGDKPWTLAEHEAIRARLMQARASPRPEARDAVLPLRVGDGEVPDIPFNTIVPDVRRRPVEETAKLIVQRLRLLEPDLGPKTGEPRPTGSASAYEGALAWMASTLDHADPIERIALRLKESPSQARPGLWFYAVQAGLSDCPRALAEHLAVQFGGLSSRATWPGDLIVDLGRPVPFDGAGLWKALVDSISPEGSADDSESASERVVHWINQGPPAGPTALRVIYCQFPIAGLRPRIPGFIAAAIRTFAGLQGLRADARVLLLFACMAQESGVRALLARLRPLSLAHIPACETLDRPRPLNLMDLDEWLHYTARPLPGRRRLDDGTLERLHSNLIPLFPNDAARLRYQVVHEPALRILREANLTE